MKTPYDTARRVAERRLDSVRADMTQATGQLRVIEQEEEAAAAMVQREKRLAVDDPHITAERYFSNARDRRTQLVAMREATRAHLETLRRKAVARYAECIAIDTAIARHCDETERGAAAIEQAASDDLTGARHRRPRRRMAPATPVPSTPAVSP